jgi:taurine dioxygenase
MPLNLRPLSAALGAEIMDLDLTGKLDAGTVAELYQAWLDNVILLFRGQHLAQQDLLDVAAYFGTVGPLARPVEERPSGYSDLLDNVMLISNVRQDGEPIGALPDGDMMFHHDMLHADMPHKATLLYSVEVPREGGNTLFANGYSAYEKLPDEVRVPLEGRKAFHHYNYGNTHKGAGGGTKAFSESRHPVFRTHGETGRKAIYVNRLMTELVEEMPRGESDALLAKLFDHSEKPEFVYEHLWRPGDLILWDNRCSMHGRTDFSPLERRLFWRTTVKDTETPR